MAQNETILIDVRERGSRVVKRKIAEIGDSAERSVRGLRLLQNGLFVLGAAGLVSGLVRLLDTLTNFENRLRLVTNSTKELESVQSELFAISVRTRGQFESTAEIYTRTALAVRELGISQQETLNFTESLNQAVILSGASTREANAALIQLAQGLASARLSGDELRSVLEQLPFVADIIAGELGVTRGELRKLGQEGKLSADVILRAFRNAREEIAEKFADTIPTIGQSFQVFRTLFLAVLDQFDDFTRITEIVARSIIALALSLETLVGGLVSAAAAFVAIKLTSFISNLFSALKASRELRKAVAAGNATLLTAVGVEQAKAASSLSAASASAALASAKVREIQLNISQLQQNRALLIQQQSSIIIDKQRRVAKDALTGRFIAYNAAVAQNVRTNTALLRTESLLLASKSELAAATVVQTGATNALAGAQSRSAAAGAASATFGARLSRTFPLLAGAISLVTRSLGSLFALFLSNPITAIIGSIAALTTGLLFFSKNIEVTEDGVVSLRNTFTAAFQLIGEAIEPLSTSIKTNLGEAVKSVSGFFIDLGDVGVGIAQFLLEVYSDFTNSTIGLFVGAFKAIIVAWNNLPEIFERLASKAANFLIDKIGSAVNAVLGFLNDVFEFIGKLAEFAGQENPFVDILKPVDLEGLKTEVKGDFKEIGGEVAAAFAEGFNQDFVGSAASSIINTVTSVGSAIIARARLIAAGEESESETNDPTKPKSSGGGGSKKTFADFVKDLTQQNDLLKVNSRERERLSEILKIEDQLKRSLSATEKELINDLITENQVLTIYASILDELQQPLADYTLKIEALNRLLGEGKVTQDQYNQSLRQSRIEFLDSQKDAASGFESGFLKVIESTADAAAKASEIVTGLFDSVSSEIANLVVDGTADFNSLVKSIDKQIIQLLLSQGFQQLFGGVTSVGGPGGISGGGGNIFGSLFSGLGSLLGLQKGGSFEVGSSTSIAPINNGGNDNRLVAFRAQDGETVQVTPKGMSPDTGGTQNNYVTMNIYTPDANSFRSSQDQIAKQASMAIGKAQRRN